jgi:hypothetical protein
LKFQRLSQQIEARQGRYDEFWGGGSISLQSRMSWGYLSPTSAEAPEVHNVREKNFLCHYHFGKRFSITTESDDPLRKGCRLAESASKPKP